MKLSTIISTFLIAGLFIGCGGKEEKKEDGFNLERQKTGTEQSQEAPELDAGKPSERITLDNKGVGPVKSVTLAPETDQALAANGKEIYDQLCLACHRVGKRFIGPAPDGILNRRSPEWIMNMILNPEVMVKDDPLAKELLIEFNGSPMANQGLTEEQARAVLEYFRTLE